MNRTLGWIAAAVAAWYLFLRDRAAPPAELETWTAGAPAAGTIVTVGGARYVLSTPADGGRWYARPYTEPGMMAPAVVVTYDPSTGGIVTGSMLA